MARPSDFTDEIAEAICSLLAEGKSLRSVCRRDDMPDKSTVFRWLRHHELFRDQYARAKEESADALVEDILDIADDDAEDVHRSKLKVDARKWIAAKMKPKKYADRQALDHTSSDGSMTPPKIDFSQISDSALAEIVALLDQEG